MNSYQTVDEIVAEHIKASREMRASFKGNPQKAREYLIRIGYLEKDGKTIAKRYRQ